MIVPGAVFEIPADLASPPQRARQASPPNRINRWVVVVSSKGDCRDGLQETVLVVLFSAGVEYQWRHDVLVRRPEGGLERDSIAQTDLVFPVLKEELTDERFRGTLMTDTLRQIRATLANTLGLAGGGV